MMAYESIVQRITGKTAEELNQAFQEATHAWPQGKYKLELPSAESEDVAKGMHAYYTKAFPDFLFAVDERPHGICGMIVDYGLSVSLKTNLVPFSEKERVPKSDLWFETVKTVFNKDYSAIVNEIKEKMSAWPAGKNKVVLFENDGYGVCDAYRSICKYAYPNFTFELSGNFTSSSCFSKTNTSERKWSVYATL